MKKILFLIPIMLLAHLLGGEGKLILMRHGQAEHNVQGFYNSNSDSPNYTPSHLTKEGEAQVFRTAQELLKQGFNRDTIDAVYVSPLPRTRETVLVLREAGVISEQTIVIDERLKEMQFGELEGQPLILPWNEAFLMQYHAETREKIRQRISAFASEHLDSKADKNILVVTHACPAQELMKLLFKIEHNTKINTGEAIILRR